MKAVAGWVALQVDYYGAPTPLKSLASIAVPDASTLLISPFDKSSLKEIEKAINESDIGINPNNDGEKIRLVIPAMTQVQGGGTSQWQGSSWRWWWSAAVCIKLVGTDQGPQLA